MSLASILGYVDDITETSIHGWVCDSNNLDFSVVVEIYENGVKIGETAADIYRPDLYDAGLGNGNHGFSFNFPLSLQSKKISVKVKDCDYELPKSQGLLDKEGDLNELASFLKKFPRGTLPHLIHHYMPNGIPKVEYFLEPTLQQNQDVDLSICKRLLASFNSALEFESAHIKPESRPNSGLWEMLKHEFHGQIYNLLSKGNPVELSEYLCNGYQELVCYGLGGGKWIEDPVSSHKNELAVSTIYFDRLIALSEALSILPYENPEQGRYGLNIYENLNAVTKKIEDKIGISIGRPKVFGIHGLSFGDRIIDGRTPDHLWASWRIQQIVGCNKNICEIGGGFGGNCHYSYQMGCKSYTIIDLPVINVIQAYFLMKCFGEEVVQLFGEDSQERPIRIMPYWCFTTEDNLFDICFNQDSLAEMPLKVATEYLYRIPQVTQSYFYSIQQEACAPAGQNLTQLNISDILAKISDYKLIFRYPNWIRKGYVEELYSLASLLTINNPHLENKATEITHNLKSLLLIGFPRGFTTQSYEIIKKATGLRSSNVSAGEVLNRGRLLEAGFVNESLKLKNFPFYTKNLELYPVIEQELNKYKKGFIIKDVVHPWLVLEYISRNPTTYNVLFVSRNLNEVTFHLNKLDWRIYTGIEELQDKFRYFPTLDVELAMHDSDYLFDTVEKLGYTVERFNYIDQDFVEKREKTKKLFQVHGNSLRDINLVYNYALKINTPIKLHLHENPVHPCLRRQGWSYPELTGIWTQKKVAELIFYVDTFYGSDLCLAVEIEGVFVHKNHPKQTIEVFANEILIDKWDFNYATKIDKLKKCRIPSYTINSNSRLFISFQISNPESPFNLGISNDTRKLGVKINHIQFLKV